MTHPLITEEIKHKLTQALFNALVSRQAAVSEEIPMVIEGVNFNKLADLALLAILPDIVEACAKVVNPSHDTLPDSCFTAPETYGRKHLSEYGDGYADALDIAEQRIRSLAPKEDAPPVASSTPEDTTA